MKEVYIKDDTIIYKDDSELYGYISKWTSTPSKYISIESIGSSRFIVKDKHGYKIIANSNSDVTDYYNYMEKHNDNVIVKKGNKYGLIEPTHGNILLPIKYDKIYGNGIGKKEIKFGFNRGYATYDYYYNFKVNNSSSGIPERIDYGIVKVKKGRPSESIYDVKDLKYDLKGNVLHSEKDSSDKYLYIESTTDLTLCLDCYVESDFESHTSIDGKEYIRAIINRLARDTYAVNNSDNIIRSIITEHGNETYRGKNIKIERSKNATFLITDLTTGKCKVIDSYGDTILSNSEDRKNITFCEDFIIVSQQNSTSHIIDYHGKLDVFFKHIVNITGNRNVGLYVAECLENGEHSYFYFKWKDGKAKFFPKKAYAYACVYDKVTIDMQKELDYTHNNICEIKKYSIKNLSGKLLYTVENPDKISYVPKINTLYYLKDGIAKINVNNKFINTIECDDIEYSNGYFIVKRNDQYGLYNMYGFGITICKYDEVEVLGKYAKVKTTFKNWNLSDYKLFNNIPDIYTDYYLIDIDHPSKIISHGSDLEEQTKKKVLRNKH